MDSTTLKISMAAFFHDIGKFGGKQELELSSEDIDSYDEQLYLKMFKGKYSHHHALYTAEFIKKYSQWLPRELNSPNWGGGDIFVNLAAMHHKPETPMQWVITVADWLSSDLDRDNFEKDYNCGVRIKDYKKSRLLPILEQLNFDEDNVSDSATDYKYRYHLKRVAAETIMPGLREEVEPKSNKEAIAEYKKLFKSFTESLKTISHRDNLELWYEHFDSLMLLYTSHIPAARVGNVIQDVSLYDHCRTTSALATALYLYHAQTNTLTEQEIKDYNTEKFLLINGDFRGIQNFIFSSSSNIQKFRSKILRGRSFTVSLLSELAGDMLCREIGLPTTSVILNAAGKFTIIAPNTKKTKTTIKEVKKKINDWLVKISFGETVINIAVLEASCNDFTKNFINLWDRFNDRMEEEKYSGFDIGSYSGVVEGYLDSFNNKFGICSLCGKRPANTKQEEQDICSICNDHIFLGTNIVKKTRLSVVFADTAPQIEKCLKEPIFGSYQIVFSEKLKDDNILKCWDIGDANDNNNFVTVKSIGGYVPVYTDKDTEDDRIISSHKSDKQKLENIEHIKIGKLKTLNHIACMAKEPDPQRTDKYCGIEALGVLKADVDELGKLMACGLKETRFTLSRIATLSRQMNNYFTVSLPWFLEGDADNKGFSNIYTVFAGGDDLFLIGPWNSIIELSKKIQTTFAEYVCQNKNITISAGVSLHKPLTTIDMMAGSSEDLLEQAKSGGRDSLALFSETAKWAEIDELLEVEKSFKQWLDKEHISKVMFYKLNEFINMVEKEKQITSKGEMNISDMECTKWRAFLAYTMERNVKENKEEIHLKLLNWLDIYNSKLKIPLWKILYNRRQEG